MGGKWFDDAILRRSLRQSAEDAQRLRETRSRARLTCARQADGDPVLLRRLLDMLDLTLDARDEL